MSWAADRNADFGFLATPTLSWQMPVVLYLFLNISPFLYPLGSCQDTCDPTTDRQIYLKGLAWTHISCGTLNTKNIVLTHTSMDSKTVSFGREILFEVWKNVRCRSVYFAYLERKELLDAILGMHRVLKLIMLWSSPAFVLVKLADK